MVDETYEEELKQELTKNRKEFEERERLKGVIRRANNIKRSKPPEKVARIYTLDEIDVEARIQELEEITDKELVREPVKN